MSHSAISRRCADHPGINISRLIPRVINWVWSQKSCDVLKVIANPWSVRRGIVILVGFMDCDWPQPLFPFHDSASFHLSACYFIAITNMVSLHLFCFSFKLFNCIADPTGSYGIEQTDLGTVSFQKLWLYWIPIFILRPPDSWAFFS